MYYSKQDIARFKNLLMYIKCNIIIQSSGQCVINQEEEQRKVMRSGIYLASTQTVSQKETDQTKCVAKPNITGLQSRGER